MPARIIATRASSDNNPIPTVLDTPPGDSRLKNGSCSAVSPGPSVPRVGLGCPDGETVSVLVIVLCGTHGTIVGPGSGAAVFVTVAVGPESVTGAPGIVTVCVGPGIIVVTLTGGGLTVTVTVGRGVSNSPHTLMPKMLRTQPRSADADPAVHNTIRTARIVPIRKRLMQTLYLGSHPEANRPW